MEYATIIHKYDSKNTNSDLSDLNENKDKNIEIKYGQIWYIKTQESKGSILFKEVPDQLL